MHFYRGMQVVIESNSLESVTLFVLELFIYTRISFWQSASWNILRVRFVGSHFCHI